MLMVLTESEHENKLDHLARPRMKKKENFARVRVLKKSEKKNNEIYNDKHISTWV